MTSLLVMLQTISSLTHTLLLLCCCCVSVVLLLLCCCCCYAAAAVVLFLLLCVPVGCGPTCLGVAPLVGDLVDGVQQALLVTVGVQFELCAGVVTELGDGHLSDHTEGRSEPTTTSLKPPLSTRPNTSWYLCAIRADLVQSSRRAVQEADDLQEVVITNAPGTINQEDQVRFGCLTDCTEEEGED